MSAWPTRATHQRGGCATPTGAAGPERVQRTRRVPRARRGILASSREQELVRPALSHRMASLVVHVLIVLGSRSCCDAVNLFAKLVSTQLAAPTLRQPSSGRPREQALAKVVLVFLQQRKR